MFVLAAALKQYKYYLKTVGAGKCFKNYALKITLYIYILLYTSIYIYTFYIYFIYNTRIFRVLYTRVHKRWALKIHDTYTKSVDFSIQWNKTRKQQKPH